MHSPRCWPRIFALLLFPVSIWAADTFTLGNAEITVPPPPGFARITKEVSDEIAPQMDDEDNDTLAAYVPQADLARTANGLRTTLRTAILKVDKKRRYQKIEPQDFPRVTREVVEEDQRTLKDTEKKLVDFLNKTTAARNPAAASRVSIASAEISLLPAHLSTANTFSLSSNLKITALINGFSRSSSACSTAIVLDVSGKVIYLYVSGSGADLAWTRSVSQQWAAQILKANANLRRDSYQESASGVLSAVNLGWFNLKEHGPIAGFVLFIIVAFLLLRWLRS